MIADKKGSTPNKEVVVPKDTGSSESQIIILSQRIKDLTGHLKPHKKDFSAKKTLLGLVSRRKRLLKYYKIQDPAGCKNICGKLSIRYNF